MVCKCVCERILLFLAAELNQIEQFLQVRRQILRYRNASMKNIDFRDPHLVCDSYHWCSSV